MSFEFSFQSKKEVGKEGVFKGEQLAELLAEWQAKEAAVFSEVQVDNRREGMRKSWLEKAKKTICLVLMSFTAVAAASEARAGSSSGEFIPDPQVVGREYKVPGALEEGSVSGALEEGVVPGAIQDDGDIYVEKPGEKVEEPPRRKKPSDELKQFQRGNSVEIEDEAINIRK